MCFVRLACVKHAASVHPEPGSNSHVKIRSEKPAGFSLFTVLRSSLKTFSEFLFPASLRLAAAGGFAIPPQLPAAKQAEFSGLFHCSVIKVLRCI